jgi:hypothetical protein
MLRARRKVGDEQLIWRMSCGEMCCKLYIELAAKLHQHVLTSAAKLYCECVKTGDRKLRVRGEVRK